MKTGKVEVKCAVCGKIEHVCPSRAKKYCTCSVQCMGKFNSNKYSLKVDKVCSFCGKHYFVKKSQKNRSNYCSRKCMTMDLPKKYKGSGNPNYRGRFANSDGYIYNNNRYVLHRETVMSILGVSEIPKTLIVHHKDGNKHSNDAKNLILLTRKIHTWIHKNIGNFAFKAISKGQLSVDEVLSWVEDEEDKKIVEYVLTTNCTQQSVVLKQGELLGTPI